MDDRSSRIFFGLCLLVLVWIGVYWMWEPKSQKEPLITFGDQPIVQIDPVESDPNPNSPDSDNTGTDDRSGESSETSSVETAEQSEPKDEIRLIPPKFIEHVVQPDELMENIAKHYYGSSNDWTAIALANPRVDPQKLKPGLVLRIPVDKNNIQGITVGGTKTPGLIEPRIQSGQDGPKTIEYVVRSGDSLSRIFQRIYGSSRHARFIFESNRDVLSSMDSISIGQLLRLPPLSEDSSE